MRITTVLLGAFIALAYAAPNPEAVPNANANADAAPYWHDWPHTGHYHFFPFCHLAGQGCRKIKRAADVVNDALAAPTEMQERRRWFRPFCHLAGQACKKMRRSLDDLSEVAADASAFGESNADEHQAYHARVKRAADEVNDILEGEDNEFANSLREAINKVASELPDKAD